MGKVGVRNVYVDYLLGATGNISSTGLSEVIENQYSHDKINRMLYNAAIDDKTLCQQGRRIIKARDSKGKKTLIVDDSIQHKPYSQVNGLVAYHYDHSEKRTVKGINFINALWADEEICVPLSMQMVEKELRWDEKQQKEVWKNSKTKNEIVREMAGRLTRSRQIDYVLADSWYGSEENMRFLKKDCETHFIIALKSNRLAARSPKEAAKGKVKPLEEMRLGKCAVNLYLNGLDFPVRVVKKVFKNEDGSSGTLYLATSDLELSYDEIYTLYKRRWKVEQYHKSLKNNCSLGKCQGSSYSTQRTHFYLAAFAFMRLEKVKVMAGKNHFKLMHEIQVLTTKCGLQAVKKHLHITLTNLKSAA